MNAEAGFTRKSLGRRIEEEANRRLRAGELQSWGPASRPDGRLVYNLTDALGFVTMTPGEMAEYLGIPEVDA